jgi:hypothetical protein
VTAIGAGVIVNADVSTGAAIAHSKLANITAGQVMLGNASNVPTATALSGDVTINSSGVTAIGSGVIVDADISASAEIAVSKLADGAARQLLQTDAAGTGVEWTSNVAIPGTLAVTGATTLAAATATTPATDNNSTAVATTAYVRAQLYAPLASPALTGTPTVPTAAVGTNSTQAASTAFVLANSLLKTGGTITGNLNIEGTSPLVRLVETDGTSTHNQTFLIRDNNEFSVRTLDSSGVAVSTDYRILSDSSGATIHVWNIANTEAMRLTSDKYLRMAAGTGGIQFGGDTASANALNDYEEGTFTPTVIGTGTAGTGTYQVQVGRYTKIGDVVRFSLTVEWNAHTGTVNMRLAGLPFTALDIDNSGTCFSILATNLTFSNNLAAVGVQGSTQVNLITYSSDAANVPLSIDTTGENLIRVSGVYEVA